MDKTDAKEITDVFDETLKTIVEVAQAAQAKLILGQNIEEEINSLDTLSSDLWNKDFVDKWTRSRTS